MTIYTKTMREALEEIEGNIIDGLLEGITLEATMSGAQISQLKKAFEPMRGKKISMASAEKLRKILDKVSDDKNALVQLYKANIPFVSRSAATRLISKHNMKGAEINKLAEEIALDEAKYDLYHKDFSSAMQHAYKMAKKLHGITISPDEISDKVATGPRKPSEGKTNKYRLKGDKGAIQVQVYNKGGSKPFELNMYKEEVELDENLQKAKKLMGPSKNREQGIEFVMKGLKISKQKATQMVDKILDEEVELEEGKMSQLHQYIKDKKSAEEIAKIMKLDVKTIKALMNSYESIEGDDMSNNGKYMEMLAAACGPGPSSSGPMPGLESVQKEGVAADDCHMSEAKRDVDPADVDTSATDDDIKSADKNIMMQMRKAVSLRGQYPVEFLDKKKIKIPQKMALAVIDKYNKQKKPMDKEKFQAKIAKSYKALLTTMKEQKEETLLDRMNRKILENKNG